MKNEIDKYAKELYAYFVVFEDYPRGWKLKEMIEQYESSKNFSTDPYNRMEDITEIPSCLAKNSDFYEFNCDKDGLIESMDKTKYWDN